MALPFSNPNRPDPLPRIPARKPRIQERDGIFTIFDLSQSQLERLYELSLRDVKFYSLAYEIERALGIDPDAVTTGPVLDDDAWDAYEAAERISA